jgi:hypothetical protein
VALDVLCPLALAVVEPGAAQRLAILLAFAVLRQQQCERWPIQGLCLADLGILVRKQREVDRPRLIIAVHDCDPEDRQAGISA